MVALCMLCGREREPGTGGVCRECDDVASSAELMCLPLSLADRERTRVLPVASANKKPQTVLTTVAAR